MKKLVFLIGMLVLILPAFAEDADTPPAGVLRFTLVPVYSFATDRYDSDGNVQDIMFFTAPVDRITVLKMGAEAEYGLGEWISAELIRTPGYTAGTFYDVRDGTADEAEIEENLTGKGLEEMFLGLKLQIVGPKAPVRNGVLRMAVAPGVYLPTALGYDAQAEGEKDISAGDEVNLGVAKNALGLGGRFYSNLIFNESFFFNMAGEFKSYFPVQKEKTDYLHYFAATLQAADEVNYGYSFSVEAGPRFVLHPSDCLELGAGVQASYLRTADTAYDGEVDEDSAQESLTVKPAFNFRLRQLAVPMDFELSYEYPLMGKNVLVSQNIALRISSYLEF